MGLLRRWTENEAIWFPSKDLAAAAERLRGAGWTHVEPKDFHLTLGPRCEFPPWLISDMVGCLWDATWVWTLSVETSPGSGIFRFDWERSLSAILPSKGGEGAQL